MKYIEEISPGDCFEYQNKKFILTSDIRNREYKQESQAIGLHDGFPRWMDTGLAVEKIELYLIDDDKNIVPIKEYKNEFAEDKNIY